MKICTLNEHTHTCTHRSLCRFIVLSAVGNGTTVWGMGRGGQRNIEWRLMNSVSLSRSLSLSHSLALYTNTTKFPRSGLLLQQFYFEDHPQVECEPNHFIHTCIICHALATKGPSCTTSVNLSTIPSSYNCAMNFDELPAYNWVSMEEYIFTLMIWFTRCLITRTRMRCIRNHYCNERRWDGGEDQNDHPKTRKWWRPRGSAIRPP